MIEILQKAAAQNGLVTAFAAVGLCACVIAAINRTERTTVEAAPEPILHDNPLLADAE